MYNTTMMSLNIMIAALNIWNARNAIQYGDSATGSFIWASVSITLAIYYAAIA